MFVCCIAFIFLLPTVRASNYVNERKKKESGGNRIVESAALILLLGIASFFSLSNLNDASFQNDEWYQVEAAQGFLETGEFVKWDFTNNHPQVTAAGELVSYTRVSAYTWQVAQSVRLFGWSEAAARYPAVAWYLIFVAICFFFMKWWKNDLLLTTLATLTILSFDHFILHGRMVRMYSMFLAVGMSSMWIGLYLYRRTLRVGFFKLKNILIAIPGIATFLFAAYAHPVFFLMPLLFGAAVVADLISQYFAERSVNRATIWWTVIGAVGALLGVAYTVFIHKAISLDFLTVRSIPNTVYLFHAFADFPLIPLAMVVYGWALIQAFRSKDTTARFLVVMSAASLVMFIFFINRYDALRYNIMAMPLIAMVVVDQWYGLVRRWSSLVAKNTKGRAVITAIAMILTIVPVSIPGIAAMPFIATARADKTNTHGYGVNIKAAYEYIQQHRAENEVVFALLFRSYYWSDEAATIVDLPVERQLSASQITDMMNTYKKGWVVWSNRKEHHITEAVKKAISKRSQKIQSPLEESGMSVYYFNVEEESL